MQRGRDDKNLSYALSGVQMVIVPEEAGKSLMLRVMKQSHPAFLGRLLFRKDIAEPVILGFFEPAVQAASAYFLFVINTTVFERTIPGSPVP